MRTHALRQGLVALLILAAGAAALAVRPGQAVTPALPAAEALVGAGWEVQEASAPAGWGLTYRQWLVRDAAGRQALLYVGATSRVQTMLSWSGELGYESEGYVVVGRRDAAVPLGGGGVAPVAEVTLQHLAERRTVLYAIVGPGGIGRRGLDLAPAAAWDLLRGSPEGCYLVRVSVAGDGGDARTLGGGLLSGALRALSRARPRAA